MLDRSSAAWILCLYCRPSSPHSSACAATPGPLMSPIARDAASGRVAHQHTSRPLPLNASTVEFLLDSLMVERCHWHTINHPITHVPAIAVYVLALLLVNSTYLLTISRPHRSGLCPFSNTPPRMNRGRTSYPRILGLYLLPRIDLLNRSSFTRPRGFVSMSATLSAVATYESLITPAVIMS